MHVLLFIRVPPRPRPRPRPRPCHAVLQAAAWDSLAAFYEACAQIEVDEYRDYEKALQVGEGQRAGGRGWVGGGGGARCLHACLCLRAWLAMPRAFANSLCPCSSATRTRTGARTSCVLSPNTPFPRNSTAMLTAMPARTSSRTVSLDVPPPCPSVRRTGHARGQQVRGQEQGANGRGARGGHQRAHRGQRAVCARKAAHRQQPAGVARAVCACTFGRGGGGIQQQQHHNHRDGLPPRLLGSHAWTCSA